MSSIDDPYPNTRLSKRKLDEIHDDQNPPLASSSRMRKDNKNKEPLCLSPSSPSSSSYPIQFFVSTISGPTKTLVLHAHPSDTIESIHNRIQSITGIPTADQRLLYCGRQLYFDQTLSQSGLQNDSSLQLVGRMRSTPHPQAWQLIDSALSLVLSLCRGELLPAPTYNKLLQSHLSEFLAMTPKNTTDHSSCHLQIFLSSSAPAALVMLYLSPRIGNRQCADDAIRHFLSSCRRDLPKNLHAHCAPIPLDFCKLLSKTTALAHDPLYALCRSTLGAMIDMLSLHTATVKHNNIDFRDVFHFVKELSIGLGRDLDVESRPGSGLAGLSTGVVQDFAAFLPPVLQAVRDAVGVAVVEPPFDFLPRYADEINYLYETMNLLTIKMEACLSRVEEWLAASSKEAAAGLGWCHYLLILKELNNISKCFRGAEDVFWGKMAKKKAAVTHLVVTYTKKDGDHEWLMEHKEVLEFESRRHLVMMMLPELRDNEYEEELHEMLIDRGQMLSESFEYIGRAEPDALKGGLFMEFKNEEATGPGVLREWFFLVCQKIFNPENALFVACPNDRRRFFPNHVSKVHPSGIGLDYFGFAGRVIALALMHKLQVGIVFDRVFFTQLAGKKVKLEDIRDADPCMYSSCKKILELDAEIVDSDALGLTFIREVEELGARTIVELCPGGKSITVNSNNRQEYVDRLIEHRFVESIKEQVQRFAKGFADILRIPGLQKLFFQSLELQDLDWMLHGSEIDISVKDWKAHTDYNGFKETDPQITWFWKIIEEMSAEQKKTLLFFWTSLKCLPVEGFRGLSSRLYIYKSSESLDRLPSSHTCFYRICFPPYSSMAIMQDRLNIITQEHVSCSFGNW